MRSIHPHRLTIRALLIVIALIGLGLRARTAWVGYRTDRAMHRLGPLAHRDSATHSRIAGEIFSIGGGRASVPPLIEAMGGSDSGKRHVAASVLGGIGREAYEAVPALTALLDDPDIYVRQEAPPALGAIGPPAKSSIPALRRTLRDKEWLMRVKAAEAILKIEPEVASQEAIPTLRDLLFHPDPNARLGARRVLDRIEMK